MNYCEPFDGRPAAYQSVAGDVMIDAGTPVFAWDTIEPLCTTPMCLLPSHLKVVRPARLGYTPNICVYCGQPAETRDHLLPRNVTGDAWRRTVLTVPACAECNSLIGDILLESITARRAYVHERIRARNRKVLAAVELSEAQLNEFGPGLRGYLETADANKRELISRLSWPDTPSYDFEALRGSGIQDPYSMGLLELVDSAFWSRLRALLGPQHP